MHTYFSFLLGMLSILTCLAFLSHLYLSQLAKNRLDRDQGGSSQRKYPSRKFRLAAGKALGAMQTGRNVDGTARAELEGHSDGGGTVLFHCRGEGHMFLQRYRIRGVSPGCRWANKQPIQRIRAPV